MALIIAVGTKSALKIRAVEKALATVAQFDARFQNYALRSGETDSDMGIQPFGFDQILRGAFNRADKALHVHNADVGVGIENGLVQINGSWFDPPCVVVLSSDVPYLMSRSFGTFLPIPETMVFEVQNEKTELGVVVQNRAGGGEKDPHKFLSRGALDRESIIAQAVLSAFVPVINSDKYNR